MGAYAREASTAKSTSPELFTPLRLRCCLKGGGHRSTAPSDGFGADGDGGGSGDGDGDGGSDGGGGGGDGGEGDGWRRARAPRERSATLFMRAEMMVPSLGLKLTPIAPLALLHTALYQSLLTRGAENKLQSGCVDGRAPSAVG